MFVFPRETIELMNLTWNSAIKELLFRAWNGSVPPRGSGWVGSIVSCRPALHPATKECQRMFDLDANFWATHQTLAIVLVVFLAFLKLEPSMEQLHSDARWNDLERRVGLSQ